MKIAIDGKWYCDGPPGGRTYVRNMVDALSRRDPDNSYICYVRSGDVVSGTAGMSFQPLRPDFSLIRTGVSFPFAAVRDRADILFTQSLATFSHRLPLVIAVYDVLYRDYPQFFTFTERLYFRFIDRSIRKADILITLSNYSRDRIMQWFGMDAERIVITPCAANERFRPIRDDVMIRDIRARYRLPESFLLYVGRLNSRKNLPRLFKALSRCPGGPPLVCVGRHDWKSDPLESHIARLGLEKRIVFTGGVPDEDLPLIINASMALCYIPFAEGFGIPPLEAMACGKPVLASRATAIPEVVGDAGLLVDPSSDEEIADAMEHLVHDSALRENLGARGIARAADFTWDRSADVLIELWKRFL